MCFKKETGRQVASFRYKRIFTFTIHSLIHDPTTGGETSHGGPGWQQRHPLGDQIGRGKRSQKLTKFTRKNIVKNELRVTTVSVRGYRGRGLRNGSGSKVRIQFRAKLSELFNISVGQIQHYFWIRYVCTGEGEFRNWSTRTGCDNILSKYLVILSCCSCGWRATSCSCGPSTRWRQIGRPHGDGGRQEQENSNRPARS